MPKRKPLWVQKNAADKLEALRRHAGLETSAMLSEACERCAESLGVKLGKLVRALPPESDRKSRSVAAA